MVYFSVNGIREVFFAKSMVLKRLTPLKPQASQKKIFTASQYGIHPQVRQKPYQPTNTANYDAVPTSPRPQYHLSHAPGTCASSHFARLHILPIAKAQKPPSNQVYRPTARPWTPLPTHKYPLYPPFILPARSPATHHLPVRTTKVIKIRKKKFFFTNPPHDNTYT
ncbi:hypothetical protein L873DRAFT_314994 [Choiromyces venosus 120613-1]|uniref:Uncharacterized protein n=1 Tax=Choiromyces venosus 120613-1 TaxID=1336337 RepID=A0A3N4IZU7_9PEZI|nr:hypothetical protein L873DRAFT_314994 [Choiromyces venosus 120613-1]